MKVSNEKVMQVLRTQREQRKRMQVKPDIRGLESIDKVRTINIKGL